MFTQKNSISLGCEVTILPSHTVGVEIRGIFSIGSPSTRDDDEFYSLLGARGDSYDLLLKLLNSSQCLCEKIPWSATRGTSQATKAIFL